MGLTAVMNLVLEQMRQHAYERLALHVVGALDRDRWREIDEVGAERDERRSTSCCAGASVAQVANGTGGTKKRVASGFTGPP
ncbi:MAG TPA: hypothetical protein VGI70_09730, partial [Polyangiales bacterium]